MLSFWAMNCFSAKVSKASAAPSTNTSQLSPVTSAVISPASNASIGFLSTNPITPSMETSKDLVVAPKVSPTTTSAFDPSKISVFAIWFGILHAVITSVPTLTRGVCTAL